MCLHYICREYTIALRKWKKDEIRKKSSTAANVRGAAARNLPRRSEERLLRRSRDDSPRSQIRPWEETCRDRVPCSRHELSRVASIPPGSYAWSGWRSGDDERKGEETRREDREERGREGGKERASEDGGESGRRNAQRRGKEQWLGAGVYRVCTGCIGGASS